MVFQFVVYGAREQLSGFFGGGQRRDERLVLDARSDPAAIPRRFFGLLPFFRPFDLVLFLPMKISMRQQLPSPWSSFAAAAAAGCSKIQSFPPQNDDGQLIMDETLCFTAATTTRFDLFSSYFADFSRLFIPPRGDTSLGLTFPRGGGPSKRGTHLKFA